MTSVTVASGTVYVGLDYHDSVVQICVMDPRGTLLANRPCGNIASEIDRVEARLRDALEGDALAQRLMEMKGIGLVTAATMRAELGEMSRFRSGKQLSRGLSSPSTQRVTHWSYDRC